MSLENNEYIRVKLLRSSRLPQLVRTVFENPSHVITQLSMSVDPLKLNFGYFQYKHKKPWVRWINKRKHEISLFKACHCHVNWVTPSYEWKHWLTHNILSWIHDNCQGIPLVSSLPFRWRTLIYVYLWISEGIHFVKWLWEW